jgi:DNA repair protein RadC
MLYKNLPENEKPSTRIRELGPQSLTNAELLALALRIFEEETAEALADLYREYGSLARIPRNRIREIKWMGDADADAIQAIFELGRRQALAEMEERPTISSPADAAVLVMYEMSCFDHEEMWVMLLDTRNRVRKIDHLYKGTLNSSNIRTAEVFREAVRDNAAAIILFHNHPSGDPSPSPDDVAVTRSIVQAGKNLDINVLDHIVIGAGRWVSLKERGLGFS